MRCQMKSWMEPNRPPGLDDSVSVSPDDIPVDDTKLMGDVVIAGAGVNEPDQWAQR